VVAGHTRDPHWYTEPTSDWVATSDTSLLPTVLQLQVRGLEWLFGAGPTDVAHILALNVLLFRSYREVGEPRVMLFDLEADPEEREDIAEQHPEIVQDLLGRVEVLRAGMPPSPSYWMVSSNWTQAFLPGDCSGQDVLPQHLCRFAHYWLPDSADLTDEEGLGLVNGFHVRAREDGPLILLALLLLLLTTFLILSLCWKLVNTGQKSTPKPSTSNKEKRN